MRVYKKFNESTEVRVDGDTPAGIFEDIARLEEVFAERDCGKCKSQNIRHVVRMAQDKYKYYELRFYSNAHHFCYFRLNDVQFYQDSDRHQQNDRHKKSNNNLNYL